MVDLNLITSAFISSYEPSTEESTKHVANMRLLHSMRLFNCFDILTMRITVQQIGPGYVTLHLQGLFGEFQILQTYVPVEPLVNRVLHRFYFPRGRSIFAKFIIWGESIMVIKRCDHDDDGLDFGVYRISSYIFYTRSSNVT